MTRGQAERLMLLLEEMLAEANVTYQDLSAIGVGVGPGNFTGIRIAVSAARGLALGLNIPAVGVSSCEARSFKASATDLVAIPAPRDQVYICDPSNPCADPELVTLDYAQRKSADLGRQLRTDSSAQDIAIAIAHITANRWKTTTTPPAPLYVRPADAAPARDKPPVLIE